jgi:hypothetical protein
MARAPSSANGVACVTYVRWAQSTSVRFVVAGYMYMQTTRHLLAVEAQARINRKLQPA